MAENEPATFLTDDQIKRLWSGAALLREPMVKFTQRLIQTRSLPGEEGDVARLVQSEMEALGYDSVKVDEAGNVIGYFGARNGAGRTAPLRSVMFNTHMDHVDVGDPSKWPYPPYEGVLKEGEIWGRGASDLKGPLACQVYAGALLARSEIALPNDIYVVGVVQEEVGGLGSSVLAGHLRTDYAVVGEPSSNRLATGHRGRIEMLVSITGKSVHASVPADGTNPLYSMARFLQRIEEERFEPDPDVPELGPTTIAPTLFWTDQTSANVVPGESHLVLDIRNTPADTPDKVLDRVRRMLHQSLEAGAAGTANLRPVALTSYTGITREFSNAASPFGTSREGALVRGASSILDRVTGREVPLILWPFATDAGHLVEKGIEVIGYGPGYEEVIHTVNERISIEMMVEGLVGNAALALALN